MWLDYYIRAKLPVLELSLKMKEYVNECSDSLWFLSEYRLADI